jgi:amidase
MKAPLAPGMPGLTVSANLVGSVPVRVEIVADRNREDLCLLGCEVIEARSAPLSPIDPVDRPLEFAMRLPATAS